MTIAECPPAPSPAALSSAFGGGRSSASRATKGHSSNPAYPQLWHEVNGDLST